MTGPYTSDPDELGITHASGELTCEDVVSTFPFARGDHPGDGNPQTIIVRKPLP
jgi:hypothetical protein